MPVTTPIQDYSRRLHDPLLDTDTDTPLYIDLSYYSHSESPFQFILWGFCCHKIHGQHILLEIKVAVPIKVQGSEDVVTKVHSCHPRWEKLSKFTENIEDRVKKGKQFFSFCKVRV